MAFVYFVEERLVKVHSVLTTAIAGSALLGLGTMGAAQAQIIDFETLPGGGTPSDNQPLIGGYTIGGTTVHFGFDEDGDRVSDLDAILESRNDGIKKDFGYTSRGIADIDRSPTGEGGDFLLRAPSGFSVFDDFASRTPVDFLVTYSGAGVRNVSGQLWDIDHGERYSIEALDASGGLLDSFVTEAVPNGDGPGTFDGRPFDFAFTDLAEDIGFIRISGSSRIRGGGFAFDNFDATGATVRRPQAVPEPASVAALGLLGLGMMVARKRK